MIVLNENLYNNIILESSGIDPKNVSVEDIKAKADKEKTPWGKIKNVLKIIGIIIVAVPAALLAPITAILYCLIENYKSKLSSTKLDKTIKELEKTIDKLKSRLEKCESEEERKELEKQIKKLEKSLTSLKEEKRKAELEKRYWKEFEYIRAANEYKSLNSSYFEDIDLLSFIIVYNNIQESDFTNYINKTYNEKDSVLKSISGFKNSDFNDMNEYYASDSYKIIEKMGKDPKQIIVLYAIDDTLTLYSKTNKLLYYGDWNYEGEYFYTFSKLKSIGQKMCKQESFINAESELGYNKLQKK